MRKHITFWTVLIVALNALTFAIYLICVPSFFPSLSWTLFAFLCAFLLQLPYIWALALFFWGLGCLLKKWGWGKALFIAILIATHFFFLSTYIVSLWLFSKFAIFASASLIATVFTDTLQISLILLSEHATEFIGIAVCSIVLSLAYALLVKPFESKTMSKRGAILQLTGIICFFIAWLNVAYSPKIPAQIRTNILTKTFPTVYLLPLPAPDNAHANTGGETSPKTMLQTTRLAPVISLKDYKNSAQPLMQTPPIFIIMLEAVSSNHVGFNGYQRKDITPNMDTFARESLIFVNAFSASTHSNYAQTSFHSSQYARRKKSLDMFTRIDYHTTLLSDILAAYGYQTAFISAQNEDWQGMKNFTLHDSSFDHYYHSKNALGQNIAIERKIDDALVIEEAKRTLKKFASDKPIYMYLNLQRTHFPYNLHPDAPRNYKPYKLSQKVSFFHYPARLIPVIKNRFDNALRYVDQELGNFFAFLKKRGLYDQAIIVVAADHGEAFYEKGYPTHGTSLFNDQVKPLLLIKTPYSQLKGPRQDAISLIDVNPSILELLNLPNHPNFQGRQIIKSNPGARNIYMTNQGAIHADGLVQYPWKFIKSKKDGQRLINLELDPTEKIDYSRLFPDKKKELEQSLAKHITQQLQYYNNLSAEQRKLFYPPQF